MWDWLFVDFVIAVAVFAVAAVFFWFFFGRRGLKSKNWKSKSQKPKDWKRTSKNCFLEYLKKDWISIAVVEKYLLKALAIPLGIANAKVALSMMALGDV